MEWNLAQVAGFTTSNINLSTGQITVSLNPFNTGQEVTFYTSGTAPGGLTNATVYYLISVNSTTVELASSAANALAGTAIVPSNVGSGNMSLMPKGVVKIGWELFTFAPSGTAASYNIYRSTSLGSGYSLIGTSATNAYFDYTVSDSTTYYYYVEPVISGTEATAAVTNDTYIRIFVPAPNMALLHRWIANREACTNLIGVSWPSGIDRTNNYRCAYTWGTGYAPSTTYDKAHWDLGYSLVTDRWQTGCKMSSTNNLYGTAAPGAGAGSSGQVYQKISNANTAGNPTSLGCYYKDPSLGWTSELNFSTAQNAYFATSRTNYPGYSPSSIPQGQSYNACQNRNPTGVTDGNGNSALRLPRLYEFNLMRAVEGQNVDNRSSGTLNTIFNGTNMPTYGSCNVGGSWTANSTSITLPNANVFLNNVFTTINGSYLSKNCYSRYEISNLWDMENEWTGTQYYQTANGNGVFQASALDAGDNLIQNFALNGTMGPSLNMGGFIEPFLTGTALPLFGITASSVSSTLGSVTVPSSINYGTANVVTTTEGYLPGVGSGGLFGVVTNAEGNVLGGRYSYSFGLTTKVTGNYYQTYSYNFRCVGEVGP
jgi:hypothetical protein